MGAVDVVVDGVALSGAALHGVRGSPLFGEVHHGVGLFLDQQVEQALVLVGDVHVHEAHGLTADLLPGLQPLADARNRCERLDFQVDVDLAAAEVVDDHDLVTLVRQIHGAGPATEAVTTENENFHPKLLLKRSSRQ